jgi:hypothetical protein
MKVSTSEYFDSIKNLVKLDLEIDPVDPFQLGDVTAISELKMKVTSATFKKISIDYYKWLIAKWVNAEYMVFQIYDLLRQHPAFSDETSQKYIAEMMNEESGHTSVAYYFYKTAFGVEPEIQYISKLTHSAEFIPAHMYILEIIATASINSWYKFTTNKDKQKLFKKMLGDDTRHVKYLNEINTNMGCLKSASIEEKYSTKQLVLELWNGSADFGSYEYFEKNYKVDIEQLKNQIKNTPQSKVFQGHFRKQTGKWLKEQGAKDLLT